MLIGHLGEQSRWFKTRWENHFFQHIKIPAIHFQQQQQKTGTKVTMHSIAQKNGLLENHEAYGIICITLILNGDSVML